MLEGGTLSCRCSLESINDQPHGCIEIEDTGTGIEPDFKDQIFDSFLTGRPGGTGLGLSIVKRILKSHRGDIAVKQSGKGGTTMKLWLPMIEGKG